MEKNITLTYPLNIYRLSGRDTINYQIRPVFYSFEISCFLYLDKKQEVKTQTLSLFKGEKSNCLKSNYILGEIRIHNEIINPQITPGARPFGFEICNENNTRIRLEKVGDTVA